MNVNAASLIHLVFEMTNQQFHLIFHVLLGLAYLSGPVVKMSLSDNTTLLWLEAITHMQRQNNHRHGNYS